MGPYMKDGVGGQSRLRLEALLAESHGASLNLLLFERRA